MQPGKRPPNLTVQTLSVPAHEDSLFSPGVDTPGHKPPGSTQTFYEVLGDAEHKLKLQCPAS